MNFSFSDFGFRVLDLRLRRGFTLLELLVVVSLLGLVMAGLTGLLATFLSGAGKARSLQSVKENGQVALSAIERLVRGAASVSTCTAGPTGTIGFSVTEAGLPVTYMFEVYSSGGITVLNRVRTDGSGAVTASLTSGDVRVVSFSCERLTASGAPETFKLVLVLDRSGGTETGVLAQTFETTVALRSY